MAARFSGEDGHLNTGKSDFLLHNTSSELFLNRSHVEGVNLDTQSVDRSILALFEDSTAASESKSMFEEESENLLSALTEMLDRVEDDENQAFSPFDVLPDSEFLRRAVHRDDRKLSSTQRLQSKPKPLNKALITKTNGENCQECKLEKHSLQNHFLFCKKKEKSEAKVDIFSSTSIVSLVNLMHPYCLKLHVEKEDESRRNLSLFSQEEVWRYERPTAQESDEEINVVSDEEAPAKETRREDRSSGGEGRRLKSALLNGNLPRAPSTRERKRVSFGPVHVASFDESEENPTVGHKAGTLTPDGDDNADAGQQRDKRARALSLQEYRQLRQNKRPLVEKRGDYTTKWPSVPETPKELTPIFCFLGQKPNPCRPKPTPLHPESSLHRASSLRAPNPAESKPHRSRLKCPLSEPRTISPASPLPDNTPDPTAVLLESKRSPVKKQTLLNVDPPNPVLLPMPSASAASSSSQSTCSQRVQNKPSAAPSQAITSSSKSPVSPANRECKVNNTTPPQEGGSSPTKLPPAQTGSAPASQPSLTSGPSPTKCPAPVLSPSPPPLTDVSQSPPEEPSPPQTDRSQPSAVVESGIEASDLTSLLEQFEETQALKDPGCETEPKLISASSPSNPQTDTNRPEPAGSERTSRLQLKPLEEPREPWRTSGSLDLQTSEPADVPEPLGTEVVLSSERELLSRRQRPPSKSVQIIDPRPLPAKKTQTGPAESSPAHVFSHLPLDHDYCGSVDSPVFHCNNTKPPPLREMSKPPTEPHQETRDSKPPEQSKKHNSVQTTSHQHHPEQPWTCSEALPSSETSIMESFSPNKTQSPPSILPTPPPSPPVRGRDKRRYRGRSPLSDSSSRSSSSSSSCSSCSPKRPRICRRRSGSSSSSSSCASRSPPRCYGLSYSRFSRSRSRSWSRSRSPSLSRSPSPQMRRRPWRDVCSSRESRRLRRERETRSQKLKAIDERRVVYVGRIRRSMTQDELSERFSQFGEVECVSLHFRDRGDHYGFVTFYNMEDAFAAIDNGGKLRQPNELPFDICFGGRRQFCNTDYADLDANRDAEPTSPKSRFEDLDFDSLLKQAQSGLKR